MRGHPGFLAFALALAACGTVEGTPPDGPLAVDAPIDGEGMLTLTVVTSGAGPGTVTSLPAGVACGATCTASFPAGTLVTLSATPGSGGVFGGWGGGCAGDIPTCSFTLDENLVVNADFTLSNHTLTMVVGGNGNGTVGSAPAGVSCPGDCTTTVPYGTELVFTATPEDDSTFLGWSGGGCTGPGTCTVTVTDDVSINASFARNQALVVTHTGNGSGAVSSVPAGINCGTDCDETYAPGTMVALSADPAPTSTFTGWSGGGCGGTAGCTVTVNSAVAVNADFTLRRYTLTTMLVSQGGGTGTITSNPAGINCGTDCTEDFDHGAMVELTASPTGTAAFVGWGGGTCSGTGTCLVTMTAAATVSATFMLTQPTLMVTKGSDGFGTVTSVPVGINCGGDCSESYAPGTMVTLTAVAAASPLAQDSTFTGWSGGGCSGTGGCTVTLSSSLNVTANFRLDPNLAFVTSTTSTGNLGGLVGADAICQARANAASLPGTFRAYLSSSTASAASRLGVGSGWVRTDGKPFARSATELFAGRMLYPLRLNENGVDVGNTAFITSSSLTGQLQGGTCGDWTLADGSSMRTGRASGYNSLWYQSSSTQCSAPLPMVCMGVDRPAVIPPLPQLLGRKAFVSAGQFNPTAGIGAADALCTTEAAAAGWPGTFRALLATDGATAISRFTTTGQPWVRVDNVLISAAATLGTATLWDGAINVTAVGDGYLGNNSVFTGAARPNVAGTASTTCGNWSSNTANGTIGRAGDTNTVEAFGAITAPLCVGSGNVYCLQQ